MEIYNIYKMISVYIFLSFFVLYSASQHSDCPSETVDIQNYPDIDVDCENNVRNQIIEELRASMQYLVMGAYFSQDTVNMPGFAKFFFDSASEEREHGIKLIQYLSMRGSNKNVKNLFDFTAIKLPVKNQEWGSGLEALNDAMTLERSVTKSIKNLIKTCENPVNATLPDVFQDYHISDWLTGEYLEEQYKGERDLAGKISTLTKLRSSNLNKSKKKLADFIFDKKLLGIDI